MPPKVKITRDDILKATIELVRESGESAINARAIASHLNCSTQPIFSNFASMDELKTAIIEYAEILYSSYMEKEKSSGEFPEYKASGMAYIRFAKEEKELFKLLFMRGRTSAEQASENALFNQMESVVHSSTGLNSMGSRLFHLEMWTYVHGIASMHATGFLELDWELISRMLTDAFLGMKKQYGLE